MNSYLKTKTLIGVTSLVASLFVLPSLTFAQSASFCFDIFGDGCSETTGGGVAYIGFVIISVINNVLIPILFALAFITLVYGVAKAYIFSQGDPESVAQGHKLVLWGIIGFAIMISLWGLVNIANETFGLGGEVLNPGLLPQAP